ncbi:carboxylate--amine ligase [Desulfobacca acetoxidans]|uniref:ATP-grasp fold domain protein, DUF201-type n=1 Tax=Desulfobacca acetoxidans (strain ATCC 700848 / DSM 11109 / ASRB2) TaxID=880072 RepID=F2NJI4_DESAR|nr:ATP-grasp domain-containing protein [Desulfobacca acetoxidans]AEB09496.1 ATP-grasp fold domain protein, DUF201-type [Desulfobacca acetoxidans DSM 11109]
MATVLVTDAKQRKAVPIIRALGRRGIPVIAGDDQRFSMGFFSKYCRQALVYPSPENQPERFRDWLLSQARKGVFDILFAIDERTLDVVTKCGEELGKYVRVPTVPHAVYGLARDKYETISLAESLGIPCPKTARLESFATLEEVYRTWSLPVVLKPRRSSGSRGLLYIRTMKDLQSSYQRITRFEDYLVQEYIPSGGEALGVEVLLNQRAEPRATFVHRRLREYPLNGGPSTLRESVSNPELVNMGIRLLQAMGWYGVAMVEFKSDPRDGQPKLMEINPKFWGSIALPIASGVDFPYLLYRLVLDGDIEPVNGYRLGVRCRWLLPGDFLHFLANPKRWQLNPSFFQFRGENLYYDLLSWDDPGPLWGMFCSVLTSLTDKTFWKKYLCSDR